MRVAIEVVIVAVLVGICIAAVRSYRKKIHSGCCGAGDGSPVKKEKVKDHHKSHYPWKATIEVEGMVCSNCGKRVENTLNKLDGVWATADVGHHRATVLMKEPLDADVLRKAVNSTGTYTAMSVDGPIQTN